MAEVYKQGQRLYLKTVDLQIEGIFLTMDEKKSKITLKNCKILPTNETIEGLRHFFSKDIIEIRALDPSRPVIGPHKEKDWNVIRKLNNELLFASSAKHSPGGIKKISSQDYELFSNLSREYIYLEKMDGRFEKVMHLISQAKSIAFAFQGEERGRFYKINLLSTSLPHRTFLFDLLTLDPDNGGKHFLNTYFKNIFENELIEKILYDSRFINDCLLKNYNITINNIFDCQVYDMLIKRHHMRNLNFNEPEFAPSLNSTLKYHFLLPNALRPYLTNRDGYFEEDTITSWEERPLNHERQLHVVKKSCYLFLLKETLEKQVLQDVKYISRFHAEMDKSFIYKDEIETPHIIQKLIKNKMFHSYSSHS